jgi:hypothetical protein
MTHARERLNADVLRAVETLTRDAIHNGARAVILTGSHARGDAHLESDIDLHIIGDGPAYELSRSTSQLVSISWRSAEQHRITFRSPGEAGGAIPGWRQAVIRYDPDDIAATLQQEALEWTWDTIGATEIDRWVAEELTGYAEEVHKLVIALDHHRMLAAAVQRSILALRLGIIMGVHHRLLYESENVLWGLVNQIMGSDWAQAQSAALGLDGESLRTSCLAALDLFVIAAGTVRGHLDARQLAVVQHALALIDRVRIAPNSSGRGGSLENPMP